MEKTKMLPIEDLIRKGEDKYEEDMIPDLIEEIEADFRDLVRQATKKIKSLQKQEREEELLVIYDALYPIDSIADIRLEIKAIEEKVVVIKEMYKEKFDKDFDTK